MKKITFIILCMVLCITIFPQLNVFAKEKKLTEKQKEKIEKKIWDKVNKELEKIETYRKKTVENLKDDKGKLYIGKYGFCFVSSDDYIDYDKTIFFQQRQKILKLFLAPYLTTNKDGYEEWKSSVDIDTKNYLTNKVIDMTIDSNYTSQFFYQYWYINGHNIYALSEKIFDLLKHTNCEIHINGNKITKKNIDKNKNIIDFGDVATLCIPNTKDGFTIYRNYTRYEISLYPTTKEGYLKDCLFKITNYESNQDNYYSKQELFEYFEECSCNYNTLDIEERNNNDYIFKKTFSLKNAPSYDNFEEEMMDKFKGEGKKNIVIDRYSSSDRIWVEVTIPVDDNDHFKDAFFKYKAYYENYLRKKGYNILSSEEWRGTWLDEKYGHYGDGGWVEQYFYITYCYDKETRECISVNYLIKDNFII